MSRTSFGAGAVRSAGAPAPNRSASRSGESRSPRVRRVGFVARALLPFGFVTALGAAPADAQSLMFWIDSASTQEGAAGATTSLSFQVNVDRAIAGVSVELTYEVTDGTAMAGDGDYLAASGSVTIPAGQQTATFDVTVNGDDDWERDETLTATLLTGTRSDGGGILRRDPAATMATGLIINDDPIPLSIAAPLAPVTEGDSGTSDLVFALSLPAETPGDVTVEYAVSGTADSGDYGTIAPASPFTITAGVTSAEIRIPVTGDTDIENDETVVVTLTSATGSGLGTASATGIIANDDFAVISIDSPSVQEGATGTEATLTFTVTMDQLPVPRDRITVELRLATAAGSATVIDGSTCTPPPGDYLDLGGVGRFTFAGVGNTLSNDLDVTVCGDDDIEPNETVVVEIISVTGLATTTGGAATGTGTILNDDGLTVSIAPPPGPVTEGDAGTPDLVFTVSLSAASTGDVTVPYTVTGVTATAGDDYGTPTPASPLTIAAGATTTEIRIPVLDDSLVEDDETLTVMLGIPMGALSGANRATGTIVSDDVPSVSISSPSVREGATGTTATLRFRISLSEAPLAGATVTYRLATLAGTATLDTATTTGDYRLPGVFGDVVLTPATYSADVDITVIGDDLSEGDETVVLEILTVDSNATTSGMTVRGTGTIIDDDSARVSVSIAPPPAPVTEGDAGTPNLVFGVSLSSASGVPVTVAYRVSGGTATADDYGRSTGSVTIPAGSTTEEIRIPVRDDGDIEPDETVEVTISSTEANLGTATATGTIVDDDVAMVLIDSPRVREGASGTTETLMFTVSLDQDPRGGGEVEVQFRVATDAGTATVVEIPTADEDVRRDFGDGAIRSVFLRPAGMYRATIDFEVLGDDRPEGNETLVVEVVHVAGAATTSGRTVRGTATIIDDDGARLSIAAPPASVTEGDADPNLEFTVSLTGATSVPVSFDWAVTGGSAGSGDYSPRSGRGTIRASSTETMVRIRVTDDGDVESEETVVVEISNPSGGFELGTASATGIILDNDFGVSIAPAEADEGNSGSSTPTLFTVTRRGTLDAGLEVAYRVVGGTARGWDGEGQRDPEADYLLDPSTLTFAPRPNLREDEQDIPITVYGDTRTEADETVIVEIQFEMDGRRETRRATATILNDDVPGLTVDSPEVVEGDANDEPTLTFTATLAATSPLEVPVSYDYEVTGGTATLGVDFTLRDAETATSTGSTLMIPAGSRLGTVAITVLGDNTRELDETVQIRFTNPATGDPIPNSMGTGTIRNDDLPTLSIDGTAATALEGASGTAGSVTFTVELSEAPTGTSTVTVDWRTTGGGTATPGEDFVVATGTLTFMAGDMMETFDVDFIGDLVGERDETLRVELLNARNAVLRKWRAEGVIENDDSVLSVNSPAAVTEGASSSPGSVTFTVTLDPVVPLDVTVDYALGGTAREGEDYTVATSSRQTLSQLTIPANTGSATIDVDLVGDARSEPNETLTVTLSNGRDASGTPVLVSGRSGSVEIVDDDGLKFAIDSPPAVLEGAMGSTSTLTFTVTLSGGAVASGTPVTVDWRLVDAGSAGRHDIRVAFPTGTLTFAPGETTKEIEITVLGDDGGEPDDTVVIELSNPRGGQILERTGRATIENDDMTSPTVSVTTPEGSNISRRGEELGDLVRFGMSLVPAASGPVTVRYVVTGGEVIPFPDLLKATEVNSSFVILAGATSGDVFVRPDGSGDVTFQVTNAVGASAQVHADENQGIFQAGNEAARTAVLKRILAGIGRTIASNVVDLVWDRAEVHRSGGGASHAMVGGRSLDTGAFAAGGGDDAALRVAGNVARLLGVETDSVALLRDAERRLARGEGIDVRDWVDLPDGRALAERTRFAVSFANGDGVPDALTVWGRGSLTSFKGEGDDGLTTDSEVTAGHLGLDWRLRDDLLAGVALGFSVGDVDYAAKGADPASASTMLVSVHPYLHWLSPEGLGVWGTAGYGMGEAGINELDRDEVETDITMQMMAAGVRDGLARAGDFDLAVKADVFMVRMSADAVEGLLATDADASRARVALEGSTENVLDGGGVFAGRFELGARHDGGDAEEGLGVDLALGFGYVGLDGLEVKGRGSLLLAHEESGFDEWGLGLGVTWDPGVRGRGLQFSFEPVWHAPVEAVSAAMWDAEPGSVGNRASGGRHGAALNARLGYGMGAFGDRALVTVFGEYGRSGDDAGRVRLGAGLRQAQGGLGLELYGEKRERAEGPDHALGLKGRLAF